MSDQELPRCMKCGSPMEIRLSESAAGFYYRCSARDCAWPIIYHFYTRADNARRGCRRMVSSLKTKGLVEDAWTGQFVTPDELIRRQKARSRTVRDEKQIKMDLDP